MHGSHVYGMLLVLMVFKGLRLINLCFFYTKDGVQAFCMIYVDDIFLTGSSKEFVAAVIS